MAGTSRFRAAGELVSLAFRADPLHATLALTPFFPIAAGIGFAAVRAVIDATQRDDTTAIAWAVVVFTLAWIAGAFFGRLGSTDRLRVGEKMGYELDRRLIAATSSITTVEHLERPEFLDNLEVIRTQREMVVQAPRTGGWLVDGAGGLVVSVVLLATVDPVLLFVPLAGVPTLLLGNWGQRRVDRAVQADAERSRRAVHIFDVACSPPAGKEVRVFGLRDELLGRYRREWQASDHDLFSAGAASAAARTAGNLIAVLAFGAGLLYVAERTRNGEITPGDVFVVLALMTQVVGQVANAASGFGSVRRSLDVAARVVWLHQAARDDQAAQQARTRPAPERLHQGIELDHVTFRYTPDAAPALDDVSLSITAGSVVALVGDNGAGKTTLLKLLFGFYAPTTGDIRVDDDHLADIPAEAWRARTAACFQDYQRLEFITREAIGAGDLRHLAEDETVTAAATRAQALDVIDTLPDGLDTQLGTTFQGHDLSGGQWQKVAIARAMMRTDPLLVALDEPTSALDPLAEHALFEAYAHAARSLAERNGAITILVSHRFSTVRIADLIVVVDGGRIRETGTHEQLMAHQDLYAELYALQARHYQ